MCTQLTKVLWSCDLLKEHAVPLKYWKVIQKIHQPFESEARVNNISEFSPYHKENDLSPLQTSVG
jgi:hypothetical protein